MSNTVKSDTKTQNLNYEELVEKEDFKQLVTRKNKFITPYVFAFFIAYAILPILTGYTSILENKAIGPITWTWIYAFGLFILTWTFTTIYARKSNSFDTEVEEFLSKHVINK